MGGSYFQCCVAQVNSYLTGWMGYFQLCTDTRSFSRFDAHIRRRLRATLIRQWQRPRHLLRYLLGRGVSVGMTWKAVYRVRGHWKRIASFGVNQLYSNAWFAQRLVNLYDRWASCTRHGHPSNSCCLETIDFKSAGAVTRCARYGLRNQIMDHVPMDIGQPEIAALVSVRQSGVIDAQEVQDRGI